MKKFRGFNRYINKIKNDVHKSLNWLIFNQKISLDYFHLNFDNNGFNKFNARKPHLDALFRHYDLIYNKVKNTEIEFQLWIIIYDFNSYSDALYTHTPNHNKSKFPHKYNFITQINNLKNKKLTEYLDNKDEFNKAYGECYDENMKNKQNYCVLWKDNVGICII